MCKKYVYNRGEKCPTCKKGDLIEKFYLKTHPRKGPIVMGGPSYPVHRTLERNGGVFCNNPQCGQKFERPELIKEEQNKIFEILSKEIAIIGSDTKTVFPEELLDEFIPSNLPAKFPKKELLEMLGAAMGKKIEKDKFLEGTEEEMLKIFHRNGGFEKRPDEKLYAFFNILSEIEKQTLNLKFETLKKDFQNYRESVKNDKNNRLHELSQKEPISIPKGILVNILYENDDRFVPRTTTRIIHQDCTRVEIKNGPQKGIHFIPYQSLVHESDKTIQNLKKYWPKNIVFE